MARKRVILELNIDEEKVDQLLEAEGVEVVYIATHGNTAQSSIVEGWIRMSSSIAKWQKARQGQK